MTNEETRVIVVDDDWIEEVFNRIPSLEITLNGDATVLGPTYLKEKLVQCRNFTNEINQYLQIVKREIWHVERNLGVSKAEYKIDLDELIATDETVRRGTSYKDRVAIANQILDEKLKEISDLENNLRDLKSIEEVIKVKLSELRSANSDIRTAKQLVSSELTLQGYLGSDGQKEPGENVNEDPTILLDGVPESDMASEKPEKVALSLFDEDDLVSKMDPDIEGIVLDDGDGDDDGDEIEGTVLNNEDVESENKPGPKPDDNLSDVLDQL